MVDLVTCWTATLVPSAVAAFVWVWGPGRVVVHPLAVRRVAIWRVYVGPADSADLEAANCISIDDVDLSALNLGMIAAYYDVAYTTLGVYLALASLVCPLLSRLIVKHVLLVPCSSLQRCLPRPPPPR
jgi:hypothetical protein